MPFASANVMAMMLMMLIVVMLLLSLMLPLDLRLAQSAEASVDVVIANDVVAIVCEIYEICLCVCVCARKFLMLSGSHLETVNERADRRTVKGGRTAAPRRRDESLRRQAKLKAE